MPSPLDLDDLIAKAAPPPSQVMTRAERLESEDLAVALGAFDRSDLDPLVKILIEKSPAKSTPLKDSDAYRTGDGDHHRYIPQIVEEVRWWGSHDLQDINEPRSYRTVVIELCEKAQIPVTDTTSVFDMERLMVKKQIDAGEMGGSKLGTVAKAATKFGILRLIGAANPVGLGLTAAWTLWDLMGPNHKMTGQCVMAIAEARMRLWCAAIADEMEVVE